MILGGLIKTSTLDYPSRLSAVIFTQGCNFHCPYCHNPALVPFRKRSVKIPNRDFADSQNPQSSQALQGPQTPKDAKARPAEGHCAPKTPEAPEIDETEVLAFLKKRRGLLDGVVISGGEPACQDLEEMIGFLGALKKMGYPVKLDTNGSRPEAIQALLERGLVDYLAVDVKADPERYPASIADKCESARIEKTIALVFGARQKGMVEAEFRTTCFSPVVSEKVIMDIAARLKGAIPLYLQAFRSGEVLNPALVGGAGAQPDKETLARWALKASALLPCRVR